MDSVHFVLVHCVPPLDTTLMMMSPKDSVSPTIAGTKQSPTNSLIVNVSLLSTHFIAHPATNWNVKSGENIA